MSPTKLAIGTVQFGLDYGINNTRGQVSLENAATILREARGHGIDTLDTAIAYGNCEERLGEIGIDGWQVVTKIPAIPEDCPNARGWILSSVEQSLKRLKTDRVHGLLLHKPSQLLERHGEEIYETLTEIRREGRVARIGISIYEPCELDPILPLYPVDLVQAPFNLLDQRLRHTGWMDRFQELGIELHVRSVFLQGLLLMDSLNRIHRFPKWESLWIRYDRWLKESGLQPLEACLAHALSCPAISRVIVGVDSPLQLREIVRAAASKPMPLPADLITSDVNLLNPALWPI